MKTSFLYQGFTLITNTMTKLQKQLKTIIDEETTASLRGDVAQSILDKGGDDEIKSYISDVLQHGCVSGIVSDLIYYTDTKDFYISHMDEIEELKNEVEDSLGEPLGIGTPMFNWLAWFAYEETTRKIADELGLEY